MVIMVVSGCTKDSEPDLNIDTEVPTIISVVPAEDMNSVPRNTVITVTFSEPVDTATLNNSSFKLRRGAAVVNGRIACSETTVTFIPFSRLEGSTTYTATVTTGVKDISNNAIAEDFGWSFETEEAPDEVAPGVISVTPSANATQVPVSGRPSVSFNESMNISTINSSTFQVKQGTSVIPGTIDFSENTAIFIPSVPLESSKIYTVVLTNGVKDVAGNPLQSEYSWSFTTGAPADVTKPAVSSVDPAANAVSVPVNALIKVTFSEPMDPATISNATFTFKQGSTVVPGTVTSSGSTATFSPTSALLANSAYSATVTMGVKDISGNTLGSNYSWTFTTAAITPVDVTKPVVSSVNPAANAVSIPVNAKPQVTFSEPVDPSSISNTTITLKQGSTLVAGTVTVSGSTATFSPTSALSANTAYSATVTTGVKDISGNTLGSNYSWTFKTAASAPVAKSFTVDVVPVLKVCNACHNHNWTTSSDASTFHANLVKSGHINLTTPTSGKIYSKVNGGHPSSGVTSTQKTTVLTWIKEGSKDN